MLLLSSADSFKINFLKNSFRNSFRMLNGLDPECPDLDPNCLQMLSPASKQRVLKVYFMP